MLSGRLAWDEPEHPLARLAAERRAAGAPLLDLTESNPTRVGLTYPWAEILAALSDPGALRYEPSPRGLAVAREAVAADYARRGAAVDPAAVVLTASSSEAYSLLFKVFCDPGDTVLVPEPSYPLFEALARLDGVTPRPYRLDPDDGWAIDFASVAGAAGEGRPRAVVAVSPNNPTGTVLGEDDLARLVAVCADRRCALIVDEVFADYAPAAGSGQVPVVAARRLPVVTASLGGLSKSCGLPQLKLGWMAITGPCPDVATTLAALDLAADTYLSVSTPVQLALPRLLALGQSIRRQIRERVAQNRAALAEAVRPGSPCTVLPVSGGWSAIVRVPATRTDESWALALLDEDGVLVQPGYLFDLPPGAYLVLSLLPEPARFVQGVERLLTRCGRE